MKIACIILTSNKTKEMYNYNYSLLSKMSKESKYDIDIFTYYNEESIDYRITNNFIEFSFNYLKTKFNYNHLFDKEPYIGVSVFPLFDLYMNHKDKYDIYMFYEDDVMFNNSANLFDRIFDTYDLDSYDIIFQNPRKLDEKWHWNKSDIQNCNFIPYRGLLNLYVIKKNLIQDLIDYIGNGYYGHHEYLINGFVMTQNKYKIKYISDIYTIYTTFNKIDRLDKKYDIIHPIKKLDDFKRIENNLLCDHLYKTCIMTMIKNERLYIKEWVDYHLNLGFDDIFIFEDYGSESHKDIFKGYNNVHIIKIENTRIYNYKTCKTQIQLMKYFLEKLKDENKYDWCLFSDVDEFLYLEPEYTLHKLLFEYDNYPGIFLSWKMYTANGHIKCPKGNVVDNYTEFTNNTIDGNKIITQWNKKSLVNIHMASTFLTNHCIKDGVDIDYSNNINNKLLYKKAWLNHYFTKSWEDFCYRMETRGNMSNNNRTYDQFFDINTNMNKLKKELIFNQRYKHTLNTQYISKEYKLISGGNINDIKKLNNEK